MLKQADSSILESTEVIAKPVEKKERSSADVGLSLLALHQAQQAPSRNPQMVSLFTSIGATLDLLRERLAQPPIPANAIQDQLAQFNTRLQLSQDRAEEALDLALRSWKAEREAIEQERRIEMEALQIQAQLEVNRLLRVLWLGTGLAATGAGIALFLLRT